jgi:uncharacterized NAD-dependent epimerase/dehydratase family protein
MTQKLPKIEKNYSPSTDWNKTNPKDISDTVTYGSIDESIDSIDKLLKGRTASLRVIIKETGATRDQVTNAVAKMVDRGKAIVTSFREYEGIEEAQLKIF